MSDKSFESNKKMISPEKLRTSCNLQRKEVVLFTAEVYEIDSRFLQTPFRKTNIFIEVLFNTKVCVFYFSYQTHYCM